MKQAFTIYFAMCGAALLSACGSEPELRGIHLPVGGATYFFISHDEDLGQAFKNSFRNADNENTWYRISFSTSDLRSTEKHEIDLSLNPDTGVSANPGDGVLHLGPTPTGNVRMLEGFLVVEKRLSYNPVAACLPIPVSYSVALNATYEKTISVGGALKTVRKTLKLEEIRIPTDEVISGC